MTDDPLPALRREIDRIDAGLHGLLMERGQIIDRLVAVKGTAASGSAFRPEREAAMLGVLAERHRGRLPLDSVEGIWRVIISTFTHVQAPFRIHVALDEADADAARDSARFHFGFTVPLVAERGAAEAVAAVAASRGDLGLVPVGRERGAWWRALVGEDAPKVIARLPFLDRPGHPAPLPILVVSRRLSEEGLGAVLLHASATAPEAEALARLGGEVVASAGGSHLVASPRAAPEDARTAALGESAALVGSHPDAIRVSGPPG